MIGVDVDPEMRERNVRLAEELGWDHLDFVVGTIAEAELTTPVEPIDGEQPAGPSPDWRPDVVLALHACDTATDEALARAIAWDAPVVLAAPCCHHDIQRQLAGHGAPSPYRLATRHGILGERLADVLTDALRAALVRQRGYRVDVVEFVESRHTPRNTMLRAVRTEAPPSPAVQADYDRMVEEWGVRPALAALLDASVNENRATTHNSVHRTEPDTAATSHDVDL